MNPMVHVPFLAVKIVILVLGTSIASLALLASRRNRDRLMLFLAIGFGLLTLGSFLEAFLYEILGWDIFTVHVIESGFSLAGLGAIALLLRPRSGARLARETP